MLCLTGKTAVRYEDIRHALFAEFFADLQILRIIEPVDDRNIGVRERIRQSGKRKRLSIDELMFYLGNQLVTNIYKANRFCFLLRDDVLRNSNTSSVTQIIFYACEMENNHSSINLCNKFA